jgi:hypothetical protein
MLQAKLSTILPSDRRVALACFELGSTFIVATSGGSAKLTIWPDGGFPARTMSPIGGIASLFGKAAHYLDGTFGAGRAGQDVVDGNAAAREHFGETVRGTLHRAFADAVMHHPRTESSARIRWN